MQRKETRKRVCFYRKATFQPNFELATGTPLPRFTLEEALQIAIDEQITKKEVIQLQANELDYIETIDIKDKGLMKISPSGRAGVIYMVRKGDFVAASNQTDLGSELIQAQIKDEQNNPKDPAINMTYFAVIGNHVAYFSEMGGADARLTYFFNDLLKRQTKTIEEFFTLELQPLFNPNVRERIKKHGVKRIGINSNTKAVVCNGFLERLKAAVLWEGEAGDNIIVPDSVKASVNTCHFTCYITADAKDAGIKQDALGKYVSALTDEQLLGLSLTLGDDSTVREGEVSASGKLDVEFINGVISPTSAKLRLGKWLHDAIANKTIS